MDEPTLPNKDETYDLGTNRSGPSELAGGASSTRGAPLKPGG